MIGLKRRIEALEARKDGMADTELAEAVLEREADLIDWLRSGGGSRAEKAALLDHIIKNVDGRSKGLPQERTHR